jgi:hypothetical protein
VVNPEFEELSERVNRSLIAFLGIELDLGFTFARTAEIAADVENREDFELARKNAYRALTTVHQFQAWIFDSVIGIRIQARAADLGRLIFVL